MVPARRNRRTSGQGQGGKGKCGWGRGSGGRGPALGGRGPGTSVRAKERYEQDQPREKIPRVLFKPRRRVLVSKLSQHRRTLREVDEIRMFDDDE